MPFLCHWGIYHFWRMPMGVSYASQLFQRVMAVTLKGIIGIHIILYIDDIVIFSLSEDEPLERLEEVFQYLCHYKGS